MPFLDNGSLRPHGARAGDADGATRWKGRAEPGCTPSKGGAPPRTPRRHPRSPAQSRLLGDVPADTPLLKMKRSPIPEGYPKRSVLNETGPESGSCPRRAQVSPVSFRIRHRTCRSAGYSVKTFGHWFIVMR